MGCFRQSVGRYREMKWPLSQIKRAVDGDEMGKADHCWGCCPNHRRPWSPRAVVTAVVTGRRRGRRGPSSGALARLTEVRLEAEQLAHQLVDGEGDGDHRRRLQVVDAQAAVQAARHAVLPPHHHQRLQPRTANRTASRRQQRHDVMPNRHSVMLKYHGIMPNRHSVKSAPQSQAPSSVGN